VYLVTSLAAKGQTERHGATQTSQLVNIADFFQSHILPELSSNQLDAMPVLKATCIKYVLVFRSQLPREAIVMTLPLLVKLLASESLVVHSYSAHAIEKIFMIKSSDGQPMLKREDLAQGAELLLTSLFAAMERPGSEENEYIMKAVMRSFSILQEAIIPFVGTLVTKITEKIIAVSKNPSKPHFNHYLFESICVAIRITCKADASAVSSFEAGLFPPFQEILQLDVQEFMPYVFQILSLMLELHTAGTGIPDAYMALFSHLLQPVLWERLANMPPLVRLLQAYIEKGGPQIAADKISGLLGIFQKLIASKANDHQGFYLLNTMVESLPKDLLSSYIKQVFILLFQRLMSSKTTKYVKSLLVFFSVYAMQYSAASLVEMIDGIQPKMFLMVVDKLFNVDTQKISGGTERKITAVGITKILTEAPVMLQSEEYTKSWVQLLQVVIGLFELPEDDSTPDDEHFIEIEDTPGYQASYSQLVFAGKKEHDPCAGVGNVKINLANALSKLSSQCPGKLPGLISGGLPAEAANFLQQYLTAANVRLS